MTATPDRATAQPTTTHLPQDFAAELRGALDGQARFDPGTRALYSTDASNYRRVPVGVVPSAPK